jgi:predicted O-methyltransferase YrrM
LDYRNFLVLLCQIFKPKTYLELGVRNGSTFNMISNIVDKSIAVDLQKQFNPTKKQQFFEGTTDDFFKQNTEIFDMIFIDANHDFDFAKRDTENSIKVLSKNGIITLHDTDPVEERLLSRGFCSDSYKIIDYLYLNYSNTFDIFTFPIGIEGLTIIKRKENRRCLSFVNLEKTVETK